VPAPRYRFATWLDSRDLSADPVFVELYDHDTDPNETVNVAADHPEVVKSLSSELKPFLKLKR